jgi:2-polyprenyl-6-methoxyphenol hydroxylase-like FAD-dependent oxidoreductase
MPQIPKDNSASTMEAILRSYRAQLATQGGDQAALGRAQAVLVERLRSAGIPLTQQQLDQLLAAPDPNAGFISSGGRKAGGGEFLNAVCKLRSQRKGTRKIRAAAERNRRTIEQAKAHAPRLESDLSKHHLPQDFESLFAGEAAQRDGRASLYEDELRRAGASGQDIASPSVRTHAAISSIRRWTNERIAVELFGWSGRPGEGVQPRPEAEREEAPSWSSNLEIARRLAGVISGLNAAWARRATEALEGGPEDAWSIAHTALACFDKDKAAQDAAPLASHPLSKLRKRDLVAGVDGQVHPIAGQRIERALIIGAGPAGMMAAIELQRRGIQATVLEKRGEKSTLEIQFGLKQETLDSLAALPHGAFERLSSSINYLDAAEWRDEWAGRTSYVAPRYRAPDPKRTVGGGLQVFRDPVVAQISSADLTNGLRAVARDMGVRVLYGADAHIEPRTDRPGRHQVKALNVAGEPLDCGDHDLCVIADGSGSKTRSELGIGRSKVGPHSSRYIAGIIDLQSGGVRRRLDTVSEDGQHLRHLTVGVVKTGKTRVLIEVPAGLELKEPREVEAFFRQHAPALLFKGTSVHPDKAKRMLDTVKIEAGGPAMFSVENARAERTTAGEDVIIIGDSARVGHFTTTGGMNGAMAADRDNLIRLIEHINGGAWTRRLAFAAFERQSDVITRERHETGNPDFVSDAHDPDIVLPPPTPSEVARNDAHSAVGEVVRRVAAEAGLNKREAGMTEAMAAVAQRLIREVFGAEVTIDHVLAVRELMVSEARSARLEPDERYKASARGTA